MIMACLAAAATCAAFSLSCLWLAWDAHRAVGEAERVIRQAEELWADRYDLAIIEGDTVAELAALHSQGAIMHARQRLQSRKGTRWASTKQT